MMRSAIGGELVKWNATRFGKNYMFLQSFIRKKEQFMQLMVSAKFQGSRHFKTDMGKEAYRNLTNLEWWENMQSVLDDVEPLYIFLRFADQDKVPTLGEVLMQYHNTKETYASNFSQTNPARFDQIMGVIDNRMATVLHGTYAQAACALNPLVHYTMGTTSNLMIDLRIALERMCETNTAAIALQQAEFFRQKAWRFCWRASCSFGS
jgi:hypothetical protein